MANLTTKYLGLELKNPIVVGASELTNSVENVKELAEAGAGAVVLKSLFEEQILMELKSGSEQSFDYVSDYLDNDSVENYLNLIRDAKKAVDIPVIASINCYDENDWMDFIRKIQDAGADAIEINMFIMPADETKTGDNIEVNYLNITKKVLEVAEIPVSLKVSSYFSGLANFMNELSVLGVDGLGLFNRFYTPKVDVEAESLVAGNIRSTSHDNANTLRWIGILSGKLKCDLSASTGIHTAEDVIANLLVGATTTQMVSAIMEKGAGHIKNVLNELEAWMAKKSYNSLDDFRGKLNQKNVSNPVMFERAQFMKYFHE